MSKTSARHTRITPVMRSESDQGSRGRLRGNRPSHQQPRARQNNQTFDSNASGVRIRGSASQVYERYLALAQEAARSEDRVAAENFHQHAEHYFRISNPGRDANLPETPGPTAPITVESDSAPPEPGQH